VGRHVDASVTVAPPAARTSARAVAATSWSICRRRAPLLAVVGIVLFGPLALFEAWASQAAHRGFDAGGRLRAVAVGGYLGISLLMLGSALCAGLLDTVVGHEFGHEDVGWRRALRTLPYGRLVAVDVLQALAIGTGSLLGWVPGLLVFTLTCLAGSLVMIEERSSWSAMRRSTAMTRRRIGLTFLVVTLPVAIEHQVLHALEGLLSLPFLVLWLVHAVTAVVVLVPVVVTEITLAHHLRHDELATAHDPDPAHG
jgi:hypothetical protein